MCACKLSNKRRVKHDTISKSNMTLKPIVTIITSSHQGFEASIECQIYIYIWPLYLRPVYKVYKYIGGPI